MAIGSSAPQAQPGQLVDIGTVAAANIARAINAPEAAVPSIRNAIRDEIGAMSSHFTMAVADVQTNYEVEVARIKSEWSFVKQNPYTVGLVSLVLLVVGGIVGHLV